MNARALAVGLAAAMAAPAAAQDAILYGGAALEFLNRPDGDEEPNVSSVEAYVEGELSGFYLGVWARQASVEGYDRLDYYLGYRRDLDSGFSYDAGYYRYGYPGDRESDYGELYIGVAQTLGDSAWVQLDLAYDPENELANAYVGAEYYPADRWTISANYGTYEVADAPSEQEWDFGATYSFTDEASVDLRWYDGTEYVQGYVGLFLAFDTTLLGG
jgi:uncharacterized protein (TIGR02001 family)